MKSSQVSGGAALVLGLALASSPMVATAKTITVRPNQSIQAAVNAAAAGDTVNVLSGVYNETGTPYPKCAVPQIHEPTCAPWDSGLAAVLINKPLRLIASGQVRIQGLGEKGALTDGIVALGAFDSVINGVEIIGFTVDGFAGSGISLAYVTNFNIENNVTSNMKDMGIWPTLSSYGQVKKNIAYGTKDSALWVEASQYVRVINNELYNSPTGLEVTISRDVTMENNNIHDNTVGIGLYHPAGAGLDPKIWPTYEYVNWSVANNDVHHNNNENPANGGLTGELPPGIGVLISGASGIDVKQNRIEANYLFGVAMIDWCVGLEDPTCGNTWSSDLPDQYKDPTVNDTKVVGNKFAGNGISSLPIAGGAFTLPGSDIVYVGADFFSPYLPSGDGNCQSDNKLIKTPTPKDPGPVITSLPAGELPAC